MDRIYASIVMLSVVMLTGIQIFLIRNGIYYLIGIGAILLLSLLHQQKERMPHLSRGFTQVHSGQIELEAITVSHLAHDVLDLISATSTGVAYQTFILTTSDISNKYVDLAIVPSKVHLTVSDGLDQQYGEDYALISDGAEVKRITWDGNHPDVSIGLVSLLSVGDELQILSILS
jgi:hypothetical protein